MRPRFLVVLIAVLIACPVSGSFDLALGAAGALEGFVGVEYYGSSQLTKMELEKLLGLRTGASPQAVAIALGRLKKQLDARHIEAHAEVVQAQPGQLYVVVDVVDPSSEAAPTRRLNFPHHVNVTTEKPFILLGELNHRLDDLKDRGQPATEEWRGENKFYSDEPANQFVEEILRYAPTMRKELIAIVDTDPNPERRCQAIELLGWSGEIGDTGFRLIDALDDSDPYVRASVDRYFFPRITNLPPDFMFDRLAAAFSRQIIRPSHEDRTKGLHCLLALCIRHPELITAVREANESAIKNLADSSALASVKIPSEKLLALFAEDVQRRAQSPLPWLK